MIFDKVTFMRRGAETLRFHCFVMQNRDVVGKHTFNIISILRACVPPEMLSVDLLLAAHEHDLPECDTGDIPAPFKRSVAGFRESIAEREDEILLANGIAPTKLNPTRARWLKIADSMEGAFTCADELRRGNGDFVKPYHTFMKYINELLCSYDTIEKDEVYENFQRLYDELHRSTLRYVTC